MTPEDKKLLGRILSRAEEEGDCLLWRGSMSTNGHQLPVVWTGVGRRMKPVRPILAALWGLKSQENGRYWVATCGTKGCIKKEHIRHLTASEHAHHMNRLLADSPVETIRRAKISATMRSMHLHLTPEQINEMIAYPANCAETAEVFGVGPSTVSKYRRRGSTGRGVFSGLGAR